MRGSQAWQGDVGVADKGGVRGHVNLCTSTEIDGVEGGGEFVTLGVNAHILSGRKQAGGNRQEAGRVGVHSWPTIKKPPH